MTAVVAWIRWRSLAKTSSGRIAMHSATIASAPSSAARATNRSCSRTEAGPRRGHTSSRPSGRIRRGSEPVVLATTLRPLARSAAAIRRVVVDLPRVPATWMRTGMAHNVRRCRHATKPCQTRQPASAMSASANSRASEMCSPAGRPIAGISSERMVIFCAPCSAAREQLLQRLSEVDHVVDHGERNVAALGDARERAVGVAVLADDQIMGARRGELDQLIGERVAAFLAAHVQHDDIVAVGLGGVEQLAGACQFVLDGDAGIAKTLEACTNSKEHGLDLGELVGFGARIVLEGNARALHGELHLEGIKALADRGHQDWRARFFLILGWRGRSHCHQPKGDTPD